MTFRRHISQALAASGVHGPDIHASLVRASCAERAPQRLEHLASALSDATDIVRDIRAAIAAEMKVLTPQEAAERCRAVIEEFAP